MLTNDGEAVVRGPTMMVFGTLRIYMQQLQQPQPARMHEHIKGNFPQHKKLGKCPYLATNDGVVACFADRQKKR